MSHNINIEKSPIKSIEKNEGKFRYYLNQLKINNLCLLFYNHSIIVAITNNLSKDGI